MYIYIYKLQLRKQMSYFLVSFLPQRCGRNDILCVGDCVVQPLSLQVVCGRTGHGLPATPHSLPLCTLVWSFCIADRLLIHYSCNEC